jgi:tetratricopeptide (TPR) repeat protein
MVTGAPPMNDTLTVGLLSCCLLLGCAQTAAHGANTPQGSPASAQTPTRVELSRTIITPDSSADVGELFTEALRYYQAGKRLEALERFDRIAALDPDSEYAARSLLLAGTIHDESANHEQALARYEQLARRFPETEYAREALIRSLRLLTYLERWERAGLIADNVLAKYKDLRPFEHVVTVSAKALSLIADGDDVRSAYFIEKGRDTIEGHNLDAAGRVSRDLAQLYFALGEVRRVRAERITFVPVPANFAAVLEQRCQLLLDAQGAYSDAMRAYDAHWSTMAGYRVGELYQKLHEELMRIPAPKNATTDKRRQLFEGAMRLRYAILLEKAKAMMDHTLSLAEKTEEKSGWVQKADEARAKLQQAMQREQAAIAALPYTREQLLNALEQLAKGKDPSAEPVTR